MADAGMQALLVMRRSQPTSLQPTGSLAYAPVAAPAAADWGVAVERSLVERAQQGDHSAFSSLVRDVGRRLYGIALRVTRDPVIADDSIQEALILAWRDLPALRDPTRFEAWLTRIVVRRCYRELRDRRRPEMAWDDEGIAGDPAASLADRDQLERGFRTLTADHRAVLVLRYYAGLEPGEIADVLELPPGTVRSRLHYGISALRSALEADARIGMHGGGAP